MFDEIDYAPYHEIKLRAVVAFHPVHVGKRPVKGHLGAKDQGAVGGALWPFTRVITGT